ncbi:hypothetical protein DYI37_05350 [Fulvimarina endophytica]|uniref:Fimbrial protein n=1 Tax=Fulvimarina endophytica TaxID=2293836 RepID=A0A371X7T2_9HYPH|nr:hypothetical protein [Fulvimarina endophytica]RFC65267.1 hypothetical protein DYI37_05350 [Fulvimarina endophytica]
MTTEDDIKDEKPLDPAAERLRIKLVRLLVVSMGFLFLSIMTVFGVIIYRTSGAEEVPAYDGTPLSIALPDGSEVVQTVLDGDRMLLTVRVGAETRLVLVSVETGEVLRSFTLANAPSAGTR